MVEEARWIDTAVEDLKPGMVVAGLAKSQNRYGVESVSPAKFSYRFGTAIEDAFVVVLGLPGTNGALVTVRSFRGDTWWVWK
jgi:hypothetical protein